MVYYYWNINVSWKRLQMKEQPKISIIVPVYNVEKYLPNCLDSLVNQTYGNIEIICVNDSSPDRSGTILAEYAARHPNITILTQQNAGVSAARNTGVAAATGDYLMFVDGDDWVDETICAELLDAALTHSADCAMCSYSKDYPDHSTINHIFPENIVWNEEETATKFHRRLFGLIGEETRHPENIDLIVSPCMQLFRKDLCNGISFVDLKEIGTCEDCLFQMDVYANCRKFAYIDRPLYHYRKNNASSLTTKYKSYLFDRWQNLYTRMERLISQHHYPEIYRTALNNRILFSLIGLGLNEIAAETTFFQKAKRLKYILSAPHYQAAFKTLDTSFMPLHWKVFFFCAKHKLSLFLAIMLELIDFIRKKR